MNKAFIWTILGIIAVFFIGVAAFYLGIGYVLFHFISKLW